MPCGKRQIFAKDFAKEWLGHAISLASITIAKESLFGIAITKGTDLKVFQSLPLALASYSRGWGLEYRKFYVWKNSLV